MRRYLALVFVMVWLVAACGGGASANAGGGGGGGGGGGDLPAGSIVIFGTSFDPTTLAVTGKAATLKQGSPMVAVGKSFGPHAPADVSVEVLSGSRDFPARPISASNNTDTYALDMTPDALTPGTWQIQFTSGGRIIASGFLTVSP